MTWQEFAQNVWPEAKPWVVGISCYIIGNLIWGNKSPWLAKRYPATEAAEIREKEHKERVWKRAEQVGVDYSDARSILRMEEEGDD